MSFMTKDQRKKNFWATVGLVCLPVVTGLVSVGLNLLFSSPEPTELRYGFWLIVGFLYIIEAVVVLGMWALAVAIATSVNA